MIGLTGPRVRWPIEVKEDQSLLGIMVETAAENGHTDIGSILSFAGLSSTNGIGPAMRSPEARARLAYVLDQPVEVVNRRAHALADTINGQPALDFFGASVPVRAIVYDRRRVGLTGVAKFHHRASWQFTGMPFCTETGAEVTERCSICGSHLGWRYAAHAARCYAGTNRGGAHREDGAPFDCEAPERGANDYPSIVCRDTLTAISPLTALVDPRPEIHVPAQERLPAQLRSENRGIVYYLALRLGRALTLPAGSADRRRKPPIEETISAFKAGAEVLAAWPESVPRMLAERAREGHEATLASVRAVKRICYGQGAWPEHLRLMEAAMPAMAGERDQKVMRAAVPGVVDRRRAAGILGIDPARIPVLVRPKILIPLVRRGDKKMHGSFAEADLHPIAAALGDSMLASSAAEDWGTTFHAVEQLICERHLARADHPAVLALHPQLRITATSFRKLTEDILETVSTSPYTSSFVPLRRVLYRIGGREKPWGAIMAALASGNLQHVLLDRGGRLVDRLAVEDGKTLRRILGRHFDRAAHPSFPFATTMRRRDAIELLNVSTHRFADLLPLLPPEAHASNKCLSIANLLDLAKRVIDAREAEARWGPTIGDYALVENGVGWSRDELEDKWGR